MSHAVKGEGGTEACLEPYGECILCLEAFNLAAADNLDLIILKRPCVWTLVNLQHCFGINLRFLFAIDPFTVESGEYGRGGAIV